MPPKHQTVPVQLRKKDAEKIPGLQTPLKAQEVELIKKEEDNEDNIDIDDESEKKDNDSDNEGDDLEEDQGDETNDELKGKKNNKQELNIDKKKTGEEDEEEEDNIGDGDKKDDEEDNKDDENNDNEDDKEEGEGDENQNETKKLINDKKKKKKKKKEDDPFADVIQKKGCLDYFVSRKANRKWIFPFENIQQQQQKMIDGNVGSKQLKFSIRSVFRVVILMILLIGTAILLYMFRQNTFHQGTIELKNNQNLTINIENCIINVFDKQDNVDYHFIKNEVQNSWDGGISYAVPQGVFQKNGIGINQNEQTYTFHNHFTYGNCQVNIVINKEMLINNFIINCETDCYVKNKSDYLTYTNYIIESPKGLVDLNSKQIIADDIKLNINKGRIQLTYIQIQNNVDIYLRTGDIIIQTDQSVDFDFKLGQKAYCFTAPHLVNTDFTNCNSPTQEEITNAIRFPVINAFNYNCQATGTLCNESDAVDTAGVITCPHSGSNYKISSVYGQIYINILKAKGTIYQDTTTILRDANYYKTPQFSVPTQRNLNDLKKAAAQESAKDPVFIIEIIGKLVNSANFAQWILTYNPSLSFLKPWWLATISFGLLQTDMFEVRADLNPGFCPYYPDTTLKDFYNQKVLIEDYFNDLDLQLISLQWQESVDFKDNHQQTNNDGFRQVDNGENNEIWYDIKQKGDDTVVTQPNTLDQHITALLSVFISLIICLLLGLFLTISILYLIVKAYTSIMSHISDVQQYIKMSRKRSAMREAQTSYKKQTKFNKKQQKEREAERQKSIQAKKIQEISEMRLGDVLTGKGITKYISVLLSDAPPFSAFIDYLLQVRRKQKAKSVKQFYNVLFQSKTADDEEINDLNRDRIRSSDMKNMYEKFCYLNQYVEDELESSKNIEFLRMRGFKIEMKNDGETQYYVKVRVKSQINDDMPKVTSVQKSQKNSLMLFIDLCCTVSGFIEDRVNINSFQEYYDKFCKVNHIQQDYFTESELKENFGIETVFFNEQWIIRDKQNRLSENYSIDRTKVNNYFKILMGNNKNVPLKDFVQIREELVMFSGWYISDVITVIFHFSILLLVGFPMIGITLYQRKLYYTFSLEDPSYLIQPDDFFEMSTLIPEKIMQDGYFVQVIFFITILFYILGIFDLVTYYASMVFPMEKFFSIYKQMKMMYVWRTMWILVIIQLFFFSSYVVLALLWFIIGAIINPYAYIPFASAGAALVSVIANKLKEQSSSAGAALDKVKEIMIAQQRNQINTIMNRSLQTAVVAGGATAALVVSHSSHHDEIDELIEIPQELLQSMTPFQLLAYKKKMLLQKASDMMLKNSKQVYPGIKGELIGTIFKSILIERDQSSLKNAIHDLILNETKNDKAPTHIKEFWPQQIQLVMQLAFNTNPNFNADQFFNDILDEVSTCISYLIQEKGGNLDFQTLMQLFMMKFDIEQQENEKCLENLLTLVTNSKLTDLQKLNKYRSLYRVIFHCYDSEKFIPYFRVHYNAMKFMEQQDVIPDQDLMNVVDIILNSLREQTSRLKTFELKSFVSKFLDQNFVFQKKKKAVKFDVKTKKNEKKDADDQDSQDSDQDEEDQRKINQSYLTIILCFMKKNFKMIPSDILNDLLNTLFPDLTMAEQRGGAQSLLSGNVGNIGKQSILQNTPLFSPPPQEGQNVLLKDQKQDGDQDENKKKKQTIAKKHILQIFQTMFDLIHLFLTNFVSTQKQLDQIGRITYGVDSSITTNIRRLLLVRYKELCFDRELVKLIDTDFFSSIAEKLKLPNKALFGMLCFTAKKFKMDSVKDFFEIVFTVNQIKMKKYKTIFNLCVFYSSYKEDELFQSYQQLGLERDSFKFLLIAKRLLNPRFVLAKEFAVFFNIPMKNITKNTVFMKLLKAREAIHYKSEKEFRKWLKEMLNFLLEQPEVPENQQKFYDQKKAILNFNEKTSLQEDLEFLGFIFQKNELLVLDKLISLRAIEINEDSWSGEEKMAVRELAKLINVNDNLLESFFSFFTQVNPDKMMNALVDFEIIQDISKDYRINLVKYLEYACGKADEMIESNKFIEQNLRDNLKISIPSDLLKRILFSPKSDLTVSTIYALLDKMKMFKSDKEVNKALFGKTMKAKLDSKAKYQTIQHLVNLPIEFMTGIISKKQVTQILPLKYQKVNKFIGLKSFCYILNEEDKAVMINQFLKTLVLLQIQDPTYPRVHLIFSALYLFFNGKFSNVYIQANKDSAKYSVIEFLAKTLDIHPEFFETLHAYFIDDNTLYTQNIMKLFRRYEYLNIRKKQQNKLVSGSSLLNIQEKIIEQVLNLLSNQPWNTSFFSKELNLNNNLLDFISILSTINSAKNQETREKMYEQILQNQTIRELLSNMKVSPMELVNIFQLIYIDYDNGDMNWLVQKFNLRGLKKKEQALKSLLEVDFTLKIKKLKSKEAEKIVTKQIYQNCENVLGKNMLNINKKWTKIAIILSGGYYGLLKHNIKYFHSLIYPSFAKKARKLGNGTLVSLCGLISSKKESKFFCTELITNIFTKLKTKVDIANGNASGDIDTRSLIPNRSTLAYAVYQMVKNLRLNPIWFLLMIGDISTWNYIIRRFYKIDLIDGVNTNIFLDPKMILIIILNMLNMPTLTKEMAVDFTWVKNHSNLSDHYNDFTETILNPDYVQQMKSDLETVTEKDLDTDDNKSTTSAQTTKSQKYQQKELIKEKLEQQEEKKVNWQRGWINAQQMFSQYENRYKKSYDKILEHFETSWDKLKEMAEECQFPKQIFKLIEETDPEEKAPTIKQGKKVIIQTAFSPVKDMKKRIKIAHAKAIIKAFKIILKKPETLKDNVGADFQKQVEESENFLPKEITLFLDQNNGIYRQILNDVVRSSSFRLQKDKIDQMLNLSPNINKINQLDRKDLKKIFLDIYYIAYQFTYDQCYQNVTKIFSDPRITTIEDIENDDDEEENDDETNTTKKWTEDTIRDTYFLGNNAMMYELGVLSSIVVLRNSYDGVHGKDGSDEVHQKLVTNHIDFVLSSIEKFNCYHTVTDYMSKLRLFPFLGLSAGFSISSDLIIKCNATQQINPYKKVLMQRQDWKKTHKFYEGHEYYQDIVANEKLQSKIQWVLDFIVPKLGNWEETSLFKRFTVSRIDEQLHKRNNQNLILTPEEFFFPTLQNDFYNQTMQKYFIYDMPDPYSNSDYEIIFSNQNPNKENNRVKFLTKYQRDKDKKNTQKQQQNQQQQQQQNNNNNNNNNDKGNKQVKYMGTDKRSYEQWYSICKEQQIFEELCNNEEFKLIIEIRKENHQQILKNVLLKEKYPKELNLFQGFLFLNGAMYKNNGRTDYDELSNYISDACLNLDSDKKGLTEILSLFFIDCSRGMPILSNLFSADSQLVYKFTQIVMNISNNQLKDLRFVTQKMQSIPENNKKQFDGIIQAYMGDMEQFLKITENSSFFNSTNLKKLIWGFNNAFKNKFKKINYYSFDLIDKISISQNKQENYKECLKILWEAAVTIDQQKKNYVAIDYTEPQEKFMRKAISKIIKGDLSFIFIDMNMHKTNTNLDEAQQQKELDEKEKELTNNLRIMLYQLLRISLEDSQQFELLQAMCVLRHKKLNDRTKKNIRNNIKFYKNIIINSQLIKLDEIILKPNNEQYKPLDLNETTDIFVDFLLGISHNMLPKILKALKLTKGADWGCLLQSMYIWANLSQMTVSPMKYVQYRGTVTHSLMFLAVYIYKLASRPPKNDNLSKSEKSGVTAQTGVSKVTAGKEMGVSLDRLLPFIDNLNKKEYLVTDEMYYKFNKKSKIYYTNAWEIWDGGIRYLIGDEISKCSLYRFDEGSMDNDKVNYQNFVKLYFTMVGSKLYKSLNESYREFVNFYKQSFQFVNNQNKERDDKKKDKNVIYSNLTDSQKQLNKEMKAYDKATKKQSKANYMKLPKFNDCFDIKDNKQVSNNHEINKKIYNAWIHMLVSIQNMDLEKNSIQVYKTICYTIKLTIDNLVEPKQRENLKNLLQLLVDQKLDLDSDTNLNNKQIQNNNQRNQGVNNRNSQNNNNNNNNNRNLQNNNQRQNQIINQQVQQKNLKDNDEEIDDGDEGEQEQVTNIMNPEDKMEVFQNFVSDNIFSKQEISKCFNLQHFEAVYQELKKLSQIQNKSMVNQEFEKQTVKFLMVMTQQEDDGDDTDEDENKEQQQRDKQQEKKNKNEKRQVQQQQNQLQVGKKLSSFPLDVVRLVFQLAIGQSQLLYDLLLELNSDELNKISILRRIISEAIRIMHISNSIELPRTTQQELTQQDLAVLKRVEEGKASLEDVFHMVDQNKTGGIDKEEFSTVTSRMGMYLTEHRINEIFANIKKKKININKAEDNYELDIFEFEQALQYLQKKNVNMTLDKIGLSLSKIMKTIVWITIIMLMLIIFIFLGIAAFSLGGSFGAVVNSIIPIGGGMGVSRSSGKRDEQDKDGLASVVDRVKEIISPQQN